MQLGLSLLLFLFTSMSLFSQQMPQQNMCVDVTVFSYDRPMQLYAFLESCEKYLIGLNEIHVIYRSSGQDYDEGYQIVKKRFSNVIYHKQSLNPAEDFKPLVISTVFLTTSTARYQMFAVDDMIVTDYVNLEECTSAIERTNTWAFYLRLGKNITYCYMRRKASPPPPLKKVGADILMWKFADGKGDWKYPNNTDMTVYRKNDLRYCLTFLNYTNPNTLEMRWTQLYNLEKKGVCFTYSKAINIPLNIVNPSGNRHTHSYTTLELLAKFSRGYKIDISKTYQMRNKAPHVDYDPTFIRR